VLGEVLPRKDFTTEAVKEAGHPGDEGKLQEGVEKRAQTLEADYLDSPEGRGLVCRWLWSKNCFEF
jgi:hypothetical protein